MTDNQADDNGWRPIETATDEVMDGRPVDLWMDTSDPLYGRVTDCWFDMACENWRTKGGHIIDGIITHFRLPPDPPK